MARLTNLPSLEIITGFKHCIDYYVHRGIPCARSWPRSPGHTRAPAVEAQWPLFTEATQLWPTLTAEVQALYYTMAEGTPYTGRDVFMRSYMSGLFQPPPHI